MFLSSTLLQKYNKSFHTMIDVHLNADLGEGLNIERDIMPFLSSCSIACGGHFGNYNTMKEAAEIAMQNKVKIGAHPSYPDKVGFGRKAVNISNEELLNLDYKHTHILKKFTNDNGKIIPQRVTNMSRSIHTKITKAIKQARFLSII